MWHLMVRASAQRSCNSRVVAMFDDILQAEVGVARRQHQPTRENNQGRGYRAMDTASPAPRFDRPSEPGRTIR